VRKHGCLAGCGENICVARRRFRFSSNDNLSPERGLLSACGGDGHNTEILRQLPAQPPPIHLASSKGESLSNTHARASSHHSRGIAYHKKVVCTECHCSTWRKKVLENGRTKTNAGTELCSWVMNIYGIQDNQSGHKFYVDLNL
jgi:hypothetical protein